MNAYMVRVDDTFQTATGCDVLVTVQDRLILCCVGETTIERGECLELDSNGQQFVLRRTSSPQMETPILDTFTPDTHAGYGYAIYGERDFVRVLDRAGCPVALFTLFDIGRRFVDFYHRHDCPQLRVVSADQMLAYCVKHRCGILIDFDVDTGQEISLAPDDIVDFVAAWKAQKSTPARILFGDELEYRAQS